MDKNGEKSFPNSTNLDDIFLSHLETPVLPSVSDLHSLKWLKLLQFLSELNSEYAVGKLVNFP